MVIGPHVHFSPQMAFRSFYRYHQHVQYIQLRMQRRQNIGNNRPLLPSDAAIQPAIL